MTLKICCVMIYNVNIFTIFGSLLQDVIKILPIIYQNKPKVTGKNSKFRVQLEGDVSYINCVQAI